MTAESRVALYNRMMATRDELKPEFVAQASLEIEQKVLFMEEFRTALRVGLYAAHKNEVRTELLFKEGDTHRKEMYYPVVDPAIGGLSYFRVKNLEDLFVTDIGMKEPSSKESRLRNLNTLSVLIVPGVAFDLHGGRVGFGKGFYDKSLDGFSGKRIALAYDFQVVSDLPQAVRGCKLDFIVTEKRIIKC